MRSDILYLAKCPYRKHQIKQIVNNQNHADIFASVAFSLWKNHISFLTYLLTLPVKPSVGKKPMVLGLRNRFSNNVLYADAIVIGTRIYSILPICRNTLLNSRNASRKSVK
jgi:hypothetical protein